jgi:3-hydroxyacyl-CoA dehydrogenase/enoyl-CoA hydratase/3-hydroxybutyryl-CoA epimerase
VIEAVVEKMDVKKKVFAEVAQQIPPEAILATNTSALSVTELATAVPNPERVVGLHFFNPVHKMPLVEVIRGKSTSELAICTSVDLAITLGKTPIVVTDSPGFLVNRILGLYLNEASRAALDGAAITTIEEVMKWFGMPMGPFELMDEIGLDIADHVGTYLCQSFEHFPDPADLVTRLRADERLGKKNGKGFYLHVGEKKVLDTDYLAKIFGANRDTTQVIDDHSALLIDRMILLMVNEAARCLEERIVSSVRDVDVGMVLGTGFAPFRGGLLAYANARGLKEIDARLNQLADAYGQHFRPTAYLANRAVNDAKF